MGYRASDESSYNKNKITLDRYDKLRSDYDDVIKNFNGINLILDNPTATGYPYANITQNNSYIDKKYRDRKYLSFKNESTVEYEFTKHGTHEFDIPKGYYEVTMLSAGSGGFAIYGNSNNRCAQYPGCSGSMYKFIMYIPTTGHLKVEIGKGGPRFIKADFDVGKYHREVPVVDGGNTLLYFNNALVASCRGGGRLQYVFRKHEHDGDIEGIGIFDPKNENKIGSYITKVIEFKDNVYDVGNFNECDKGQIKQMGWNYFGLNEERNSAGGCAWAKDNRLDEIKQYTKDGKDGYFKIQSVKSKDYGYLVEGIDVETTKIHTLGNENEIRRKFDEALKYIYNKLYTTTSLVKDSCSEIGILTNEEADCQPYSDEYVEDYPYKISSVKTSNPNGKLNDDGSLRYDEYIITYDWDKKRRIDLGDIDVTYGYTPFKYGNNIVYVKNNEIGHSNVDVYKLENNNLIKDDINKGHFSTSPTTLYESLYDGYEKNLTLSKGNYRVISIAGGAGSISNFKQNYAEDDWGLITGTYVTATQTEDHHSWMYVVSVHFERGVLPILFQTYNIKYPNIDKSLFLPKTDEYYSDNMNSAFYVISQKKWINAIAYDRKSTNWYMVWQDGKNNSVGMLVDPTATLWGWDDGYQINGHSTVYTNKLYTRIGSDRRTLEVYNCNNVLLLKQKFITTSTMVGEARGLGGGSGSGFDCVLSLDAGTYRISVGRGGISRSKFTIGSFDTTLKSDNGKNTIFGNATSYGGEGVVNDKNVPGNGGKAPTIPYKIISTSFNKAGIKGHVANSTEMLEVSGGESIFLLYGHGGWSKIKNDGTTSNQNGDDGYCRVETYPDSNLVYKNNTYEEYSVEKGNGVILWSDYQYDLQKLNRLKEYVATKDSWFDADGYCQRSCQINCQTVAQKSVDLNKKLM